MTAAINSRAFYNDGYTMAIEEIGKDGDMETNYKDFANVSDAIKYIEQEE